MGRLPVAKGDTTRESYLTGARARYALVRLTRAYASQVTCALRAPCAATTPRVYRACLQLGGGGRGGGRRRDRGGGCESDEGGGQGAEEPTLAVVLLRAPVK